MAADLNRVQCPAILIAASGNHQGRTTITAALARYHRNQGRRVSVFKAGPDFLDPLIHQCASGRPVNTLDLWLVGEARCRSLLHSAASDSDLILIECSTDLYDTSSACSELARNFGIPIMVVADGSAVSDNPGDFIDSQLTLGTDLPVAGVLVNKVNEHYQPALFQSRLEQGVGYIGHVPADECLVLPDRHQNLLLKEGLQALDEQLDRAAAVLETAGITHLPEPVTFVEVPQPQVPKLLENIRIGIARDEAFAFIYHANLELLKSLGAELHFFSPLHDHYLPEVDSLWFPGGYPELYMKPLEANVSMKAAIREFHDKGHSIVAECGGMLYMLGSLINRTGLESEMVGLLPGRGLMTDQLTGLGMHTVTLDDQVIRGYVFHHSRLESGMEPVTVSDRRHGRRPGETLYRLKGLYASCVHFYFPSNPLLVARFFGSPIFRNPGD